MEVPVRTYDPWETLLAAVRAWWEVDDDDSFVRTKSRKSIIERRIARSAIRYAASITKKRGRRVSASAQCPTQPKE